MCSKKELSERQKEIHKGLTAIGPEIAQFYLDGLELIELNLGTKSNLIAHTLREIDGGLRDIFEQKQLKEEVQKKLTREDLRKVYDQFKEDYKNFEYLRDITFEDFKKEKGHISSVLVSFGYSLDHPLSAQYIKVVRWLSKYAHRSGAYNEPRNPEDIINLWNEFESVLAKLIGNYYALADRVDTILKVEEPSEEILNTLPNLLNTDSRYFYFFNNLKSYKWLTHLEDRGYFDGASNPKPIESKDDPGYYSMPYWAVLKYLEVVSIENLKDPKEVISESLVRIIDSITKFRIDEETRIDNYRTDHGIFKVLCNMPIDYLNDGHFSFIKDALHSKWDGLIGYRYSDFLEHLIDSKDKSKIVNGVDLLLSYNVSENSIDRVHSIFKTYELRTILDESKDKLFEILGEDLVHLSIQKLNEVIKLDEHAFSSISLPAIENHQQTSFPEKYECQLVYLIRDCLEKLKPETVSTIMDVFLEKVHSIYWRLSIHIVRMRYSEFRDYFWGGFQNPLDLNSTKHEVYELIKEHSETFSKGEIDQIVKWINEKEYFIPEEFKEEKEIVEKTIAYRKKEWLTALLPTESVAVRTLYDELEKINHDEVKHPGFDSWHSSLTGNISPLSLEELLKLSIEELISYYTEFSKQKHDFMGPSPDGLLDMVTMAVRNSPSKYCTQCHSIIGAQTIIQHSWIRGLEQSWRDDKNEFPNDEVFQVLLEILRNKMFWELRKSDDYSSRWFVSSVLSFIESGLQDDRHAFEPHLLKDIKKILFQIQQSDTYPIFNYDELSMTALNNIKGKIYMVLFQYSLRLARIEKKEANRWDNDIKELISQNLKGSGDNPLFFFVLGQFMPNIHFLDEGWLVDNLNSIFPKDSANNMTAAATGYFLYHRSPNRFLFTLLTKNGHIQNCISNSELVGEAKKGLVDQICTAYLNNFEFVDIESEIIEMVINSNNESVYSSLVHYFWSPRVPILKEYLPKIKPLWMKIHKKALNLENHDVDSYLLSGCSKWLNRIDTFDSDIFELIITSAKHVSQRDRYSLIDSLVKHVKDSPEYVGLVLIEMFAESIDYDDYKGQLLDMVTIIYESGFQEIGDKICLMHAEKGDQHLREIYLRFNS